MARWLGWVVERQGEGKRRKEEEFKGDSHNLSHSAITGHCTVKFHLTYCTSSLHSVPACSTGLATPQSLPVVNLRKMGSPGGPSECFLVCDKIVSATPVGHSHGNEKFALTPRYMHSVTKLLESLSYFSYIDSHSPNSQSGVCDNEHGRSFMRSLPHFSQFLEALMLRVQSCGGVALRPLSRATPHYRPRFHTQQAPTE